MNREACYIVNGKWEIISEQDFEKEVLKNKWVVLGDSTRNNIIFDMISSDKILFICDGNVSKHEKTSNGVIIKDWEMLYDCIDICAVTVLKDYKFINSKISKNNIKNTYYFIEKKEFDNSYSKYSVFAKEIENINNRCTRDFKYVHFFLDEKFVKLFYNMLEDRFDVSEHLFVIYGLNRSNKNDMYYNYDSYLKWSKSYGNILVIDDVFNIYGLDYENELEKLTGILDKCEKIIFHGEFLTNFIIGFMEKNINYVEEKGVWHQWADYPGGSKTIENSISKVLIKCAYTTLSKVAIKQLRELYPVGNLPNKIAEATPYIEKNIVVEACDKEKINILIASSGSLYNNINETFDKLYKFRNENINVYAIFSYGDKGYINEAIERGKELFGEKFIVIQDYLPYDEYIKLLSTMDIYVNASDRGGLSTVMKLFEMGAKQYICAKSNLKKVLDVNDFKYSYIDNIDNESFSEFINNSYRKANMDISRNVNDYEEYVRKWEKVLK